MSRKAIWDKLPECIFENFEIIRLNEGNFKIFKYHKDDLSQKDPEPNMWLLINHIKPTNSFY